MNKGDPRLVEVAISRGNHYMVIYTKQNPSGELWFTTYPRDEDALYQDKRYWKSQGYSVGHVFDLDYKRHNRRSKDV